jgi:hypothetical protein
MISVFVARGCFRFRYVVKAAAMPTMNSASSRGGSTFSLPCLAPELQALGPHAFNGFFQKAGEEVRALTEVIPQGHVFFPACDVMQHAFHGVGCAFDGGAEIGFRPQRQVAERAFNPFRGGGPAARFQLGRSNLHRTLKGFIAARDDLAVHELPADAGVVEY